MESEKTQLSQTPQSFDIYNLMAWLHANRKAVITGAVVVAVVGSAIGIFSWKKNKDEMDANAKFFSLPPVYGGGEKVVHPSAEALFNVAKEYPGTSIGEQAQLLAAGTAFTQGDYKTAKEGFEKFLSDHSSSPLAAQASIGVAASTEALGDTTTAIQLYTQAIGKYSSEGIAEPAKLTLARLYEEKGQNKEALDYYNKLTAVPNNGPWYAEAVDRKAALLDKDKSLAPAAPAIKAAPAAANQTAPKTK
jgi:tetratricopeptide (TPR) repeat protein